MFSIPPTAMPSVDSLIERKRTERLERRIADLAVLLDEQRAHVNHWRAEFNREHYEVIQLGRENAELRRQVARLSGVPE